MCPPARARGHARIWNTEQTVLCAMDRQPEPPTKRLEMRRWLESDREPFASLNADPMVMELFPSKLSRDESNAFVDRIEQGLDANGFGPWAIEIQDEAHFIGCAGLTKVTYDAPFAPALEVGW